MKYDFHEKFIDKNIAELALNYDRIHGANVNISRIVPDFIDGLKPVQRRALYIMFLKDQGKNFRKLASISGDTFGRLHPHCLAGDTKILCLGGIQDLDNTLISLDVLEALQAPIETIGFNEKTLMVQNTRIGKFRATLKTDDVYELHFSYGDPIVCTHDHQFLTTDRLVSYRWKAAEELKAGDMILGCRAYKERTNIHASRMIFKLLDIQHKHLDEPIQMYDFTAIDDRKGRDHKNIHSGLISLGDNIGIITHNSPTAIDDAIVGIAQWWNNNLPLIDPEGNFGGPDGSEAGASRYIKARLSAYARACFFDDWKDSVVDMTMAYDEETQEPLYLPAKYPNVLINGCLGIGYGLAANLPSFNFKEVVEATIMLMLEPNAPITLIPDSPTGCDVIEGNFAKINDSGSGVFTMRCTYEIDDVNNIITIKSLPYHVTANSIREKIADIKEKGGLSGLSDMNDRSGKDIDIELIIRYDVNPYKFIKKLIKEVGGLEKSYPVNITVVNDYKNYDYSIRDLLLQWIEWRREQKRIVISHKRTTLMAEQRTNDVKIFLLSKNNLDTTLKIFRSGRNRGDIEKELMRIYKNSDIHMDSMQARVISNMRFVDLTLEAREEYLKRQIEIDKELRELEDILNAENGIDKVIIAELRDGVKRFGAPRRSNVVPREIKVSTDTSGACTIQLSSDGIVTRKMATNVYEEPVPVDSNGFAVRVDNDASFILVDDAGYNSYVRVKDIPLDSEVPVNRYSHQKINGNIVAMLPCDINMDLHCVLISKNGIMKRFNIADMNPSKKPCISLDKDDRLVRGIVLNPKAQRDILIYTKNGMGQRLDPNSVRLTSQSAKGTNGFKVSGDDEIIGCYTINPGENAYILYVTTKGKMRLNNIEYLPLRDSKHDDMVRLITVNDRDKLVSIVGCNRLDKLKVFYDDATTEVIDISKLEESTMSALPKKVTEKQNAVTTNIVKTKLM